MSTAKNIAKSILISGVAVPVLGVMSHCMPGKGMYMLDDASLSHRFECAYSLNPNPAHKTYVSYEFRNADYYDAQDGIPQPLTDEGYVADRGWVEPGDPYDKLCCEEDYAANPALIYPLHALVAIGAYARLRRREKEMKQHDPVRRQR